MIIYSVVTPQDMCTDGVHGTQRTSPLLTPRVGQAVGFKKLPGEPTTQTNQAVSEWMGRHSLPHTTVGGATQQWVVATQSVPCVTLAQQDYPDSQSQQLLPPQAAAAGGG
jgi:hypothetical protein